MRHTGGVVGEGVRTAALALLIAAVAAGCARRHDEHMESSTAPPPAAYGTNGQAYDHGARPQSNRLRTTDHGRASDRDRYASPTTHHHATAAAPVRSADRRLAGRVQRTLAANKQTAGLHVGVRAQGGVVTLSGHVATRAQKRKAAALAEHVAGVKHVRNAITVGRHAAS